MPRFKRAAILYICGINAKLSFTYSGQKEPRLEALLLARNFFVPSIVDRFRRNALRINIYTVCFARYIERVIQQLYIVGA